jgi:2-polyprenyl-3-methyl-5-hydroxy-6-metoxy-1,4-benzoquinol methylase/ribosomal protein S18 acetylase RimI-like enzyme
MSDHFFYRLNRASKTKIIEHLQACDASFSPPLSTRVQIKDYARKIECNAMRFEAWKDDRLVGLVAAYFNDHLRRIAYITSVSIVEEFVGKGVANILLKRCVDYAKSSGIYKISLSVSKKNISAIELYKKNSFILDIEDGSNINMHLYINRGESMSNCRDFNIEIKDTFDHQYAYGFDFDIIHPYMINSFKPFFREGSLLELGSFKGDFTKRLTDYFDDITCVEASSVAIEDAKLRVGSGVVFINALFEQVSLPKRYDNIVLTHVLEHLDKPIEILKRINDEWLAPGGRLFLACPNANAPSRQIAVKMGLISHNAAVTTAEAKHGHRCTYSLDTLEHDAVTAGLNVVHRSGIFFKALANFQWDRLLQTDIISKDYLDGCYKLGQQYPDLCSSIFLMCECGEVK